MTPPYTGRRTPYTARGITRVPCARCGRPAHATWQACANGRRHVPVCRGCDVALNGLALAFFKIPHAKELMAAYVKRGA